MQLSLPEKMDRVIAFLLAVREPRIASSLALHGYRQQDHDEGWGLIQAIGHADLIGAPERSGSLKRLLEHRTGLARAETELWSWYLEWSAVANLAIKKPALRAQLGLLPPQSTLPPKGVHAGHDEPVSATSH
jgi:hypothetical protein